jgi:IS30 family transposase
MKAVYQALFVQGCGTLRRDLTACLRSGRVLRMPRTRTRGRGKTFISPEIMISQRPAKATDRALPGNWERDLILGLGSSAIGTLVERMTRFTLLLHLPRMTGHGTHPTNAVLSDAGYFAKRVTLSLALRSSGDAGRGFRRVGAAAALVAG